jgi:hypothetical protein
VTTGGVAPGTVLGGRYRLDDLLSEHDGARFWRGVDQVLGRSVAVHVVPSGDARADRLLDAARQSATVVDAHLLRVLDCDSVDGVSWVVNEWGSGNSLDVMLQQGPLPPARAAWIAREVARTLVTAHDAGVAHGRLTPEAVLLTEAGAVRLIGFVITAAVEDRAGRRPPVPGYGALDPRQVDVIDLAGVLYAGLTGRWPGISPSAVPAAPRDQRGPLRPRQVRAGVPRLLDAVCTRVLRREANEHALPIGTAHEVLAALEDHLGELGPVDLDDDDPATATAATPLVPAPSRRRVARPPGWGGDPDATQAAAPPVWDEDEDEPAAPVSGTAPTVFEAVGGRPLFASAERRPPGSAAPEPGSPAWLFGHDEPTDPEDPRAAAQPLRRSGRRRGRVALLVLAALVLLAAVVTAFLVGRGGGDQPGRGSSGPTAAPSRTAPAAALKPVAVRDFDPEGRGPHGRPAPDENPDEVPLATDGDPATGWHTLTYASARLGGLKSGVGLLVDLGADRTVGSVDLTLTGTPTTFALYAAPAGISDPPTSVSGLRRVGELRADARTNTLRLSQPVRTRFLVVWLTELPRQGSGYRGQVDELVVRG